MHGVTMAERRADVRARFDFLRRAVICEPRGHDALVGALVTEPVHPASAAGVIFFNNVGYLGMCGHGLIGVVRTLGDLGRLEAGRVQLDTPVGVVGAQLEEDGSVTIENVPSFCDRQDVAVDAPGVGRVVGDVAYGGNWFFIAPARGVELELRNADELLRVTRSIVSALREQGIAGRDGAEIDHIELTGAPSRADADAKNFVLCPGGVYDRSPCGTGTSAKMACLHARGDLQPGDRWRQESITGSLFTGWLQESDAGLVPNIRGQAYVTGEVRLRFDRGDPFRGGFTAMES